MSRARGKPPGPPARRSWTGTGCARPPRPARADGGHGPQAPSARGTLAGTAPPTPPHRTALDASAPRLRAHAAGAASAHRGGVSLAAPAALHAAKRASRREEAGASQTRPLVAALPPLPDVYNPREGSAGPARIGCWKLEEFSIADRRGSAGRALGRQSADRRALRARPFAAAVGNPRALRVFDSGGAGRSGSGVVGIQPINASNFGLKRYIYIEG